MAEHAWPGRTWTRLVAWRIDLLAAGACAFVIVVATWRANSPTELGWVLAVVAANLFAVAARTRRPITGVSVLIVVLAAAGRWGPEVAITGWIDLLDWVVLLVAFSVGTKVERWRGLALALLLAAALQCGSAAFNPLFEMVTVGPWLAGRAVISRRGLTSQIALRNQQLEDEQPRFVAESVRLERALVARELHDLVAHNVTLIVVQASATQRLGPRGDREAVHDAFVGIEQAGIRAQSEIRRLAATLQGSAPVTETGVAQLHELVDGAIASGQPIRCSMSPGLADTLAPQVSHAIYRIVQEALANAMKHAPGAPTSVSVTLDGDAVRIEVGSAASATGGADLADSGAGYGLVGMRVRAEELGGVMLAGPGPEGTWQVSGRIPVASPRQAGPSREAGGIRDSHPLRPQPRIAPAP